MQPQPTKPPKLLLCQSAEHPDTDFILSTRKPAMLVRVSKITNGVDYLEKKLEDTGITTKADFKNLRVFEVVALYDGDLNQVNGALNRMVDWYHRSTTTNPNLDTPS